MYKRQVLVLADAVAFGHLPGDDLSRRARAVPVREHTFLFVDLAGFAALTEAHGDEHAAGLPSGLSRAQRAGVASPRTAGREPSAEGTVLSATLLIVAS